MIISGVIESESAVIGTSGVDSGLGSGLGSGEELLGGFGGGQIKTSRLRKKDDDDDD